MANQTPLRKLAKDHAQGSLDKDNYRKARTEFLQQVASGEVTLEEIEYPPLVKPPEPESLDTTERREDAKRPAAPAAEAPADAAPAAAPGDAALGAQAGQGSNKGIFIGIAIAVIVVLLLAISFMGGDEQEPVTSSSPARASTDEPTAVSTIETAGGEAEKLIESFLETNNWSADSLRQFQRDWTALASEELAAAKDSPVLGKMTNAIYRQLLEEQALAGLVDDDSSLNKQKQLIEFASSLGIEDSRFELPSPPQP